MDRRIRTKRGWLAGLLACTIAAPLAQSAPWEWEVGADLSVIHTDNLRLLEEPFDESDTVYVIRPTITLSTDGDRVYADIRYQPEAFFYSEASESDEVYHVADAQIRTAFIKDALFLYLSGTNYQTMVSPDVNFQTSNLPVTGNRVDSTVLEVRPYWQQNLGFADILAEVAYVDTSYDETPASSADFNQNNIIKSGGLDLNNHSQQQGIAWGLKYTYVRVEYDIAQPWDYQNASMNLGYWFNGMTRVFVSGGLESSYENFLDPSLEDQTWEAGFQYAPNARLDMEFAYGERSFGASARANITYRLRRGNLSLSYHEAPSTRAEVSRDRRPLSVTDNLGTVLDRPGEADRFVTRTGELAMDIELAKSDMSLRLFVERRDDRTDDFGVPIGDEQFRGAAFRWGWRLGSKSTLGLEGDAVRREEFNQAVRSDSKLLRLAVDFAFEVSSNVTMIVRAQRADENSNDGTGRNYTENQFGLTLRTAFQ